MRKSAANKIDALITLDELKKKYYDEERSAEDIAKELGLASGYPVQHMLEKNGLKLRSVKEAHGAKGFHDKRTTKKRGGLREPSRKSRIINHDRAGQQRAKIYSPEHPYADGAGYVYEHRIVMEECLGRVLLPTEVVHHINGDSTDNRIENLMRFDSHSEHHTFHWALMKKLMKEMGNENKG